ncbi:MAG: sigma-70 family RNA polymerase sigma factor [Chloroflexi bacterium]|nr:sigma-70 family RNA polymerase sigma factor [Chloroflexota bacterium]
MHTLQEPEESLVSRAVAHDKEAFTTLYDTFVGRVYNHVRYRVPDQSEAEDITQEVLIRAWKAIGKFKQTGAPFVAWLIKIARNLITDYYRSRKQCIPLDEVGAFSIAGKNPEDAIENGIDVRKALSKLKGVKQQVIMLRFVDGLSYAETAAVLHKSEGAIRIIQYRALNDLKCILNGDNRDEKRRHIS